MTERERPSLRDLDWLLLAAAVLLSLIGIAFIHSARGGEESLARDAQKQVVALIAGLVACGCCTWIDYRKLARHALWIYMASLGLLCAVLVFGREAGGARSWLSIPGLPFSLQPSEVAKVAVVLLVAGLASRREPGRVRLTDVLLHVAVVGPPVGLVLLQNDAGTALTFLPFLAVVVFVSGLRARWVVAAILALAVLAPLAWPRLAPYQQKRIRIVFDPHLDPQGFGYHPLQARIAVGSGGLTGWGYREGPQNRQGFLPERHTDFIYAIVAEEWGFVGAIAVLALYALLIKRMVDAAVSARDRLGAFLCAGGASFIFAHVGANVAMVLGLAPTIGLPLPLLSYGGSAMVATFALVGLAAGVRLRRYEG